MITFKTTINNAPGHHGVTLQTNDLSHAIEVPARDNGGSVANGAEMILAALATCYCNDLYREAAGRAITIRAVEVTATCEWDGVPGHPVTALAYSARVEAEASEADIVDLMRHTDIVAEIQNTLRLGTTVVLESVEGVPV